MLRLNKDFHPKAVIKSSQTESLDCPAYLNNSNYEHLRPKNTRQLKTQLERKWKTMDMFGVAKVKYKKQKPAFRVAPPNVGMRYECNRMVVLPEGSRKEKKFYSIYDKKGKPKKSMIGRFSWKENLRK